jgi:1,2-diacylglycerol 3-beta-glucosyltransferase
MAPTIDVTLVSYATAGIVVYYVLLYFLGRPRQIEPIPSSGWRWPLIVLLVPARNEAQVIERTLQIALLGPYRGEVRALLMNDASSDETGPVADALAERDGRIRVCHRSPEVGGRGKSDVLNHGYSLVSAMLEANDPWFAGVSDEEVCICVLDADGQLSPTALTDGARMLSDPRVAAVQIGVHIRNAKDSLLARLQDIEFVGFSFMVQTARDRLGSVGLGGNGQFTRLTALRQLGEAPWRSGALTEDLDLGVRLQLAGWRLRFCATAYVAQEGLTRLRPLLRQRTRWTQGHYQCWRYLPSVATTRGLRTLQRIDTVAYLLLIMLVVLVSSTALLQVLAFWHLVQPTDSFLAWMGDGVTYRLCVFLLSWLPVFILLETYQRWTNVRLAQWEIPAYCLFFAVYVYLWVIATARAWVRLLVGRSGWTKTPRIGSSLPAPAKGATT